MQSISSSLKETMNPKDIVTDAIHNFHPQYQQYTQYQSGSSATPTVKNGQSSTFQSSGEAGPSDSRPEKSRQQSSTKDLPRELAAAAVGNMINLSSSGEDQSAKKSTGQATKGQTTKGPAAPAAPYSEKSGLLSSDDE